MANVDTGLGWSVAQQHLTDAPLKLGDMTSLQPLTTYMEGGMIPTGNPIPAEVYARGLQIYNNNAFPERSRYVLAEVGATVVAVNISTDPPEASNPLDVYLISDKEGAKVYSIIYNANDQTVGTMNTYSCDTERGGFYYRRLNPSQADGYDTRMIPHYTSMTDALADLSKATQPVYKLAAGPAGGAWVRWIDLGGNYVTAPTLISTAPAGTQLSLDGQTPAATATSAGLVYKGRTFTLTLIPGHTGGVTNRAVPLLDLTAAFPYPISLATVIEAVCVAENIQIEGGSAPYGEPSEPGGGDGHPDETEDIDFSPTPTVGTSLGFFRMWNPTEAELRQLAGWMWSSAFDLDTFKRIFSAPIDAILGLSLVPVQPSVIGGYTIVLGGIDTEIAAFTVTNRYVTVDCGSLEVTERWGAYLDYAPYTKMSIFLPYIGFRDISTDDVMGKTVTLRYNVDVLSGACVAELKCGGSVLYSWQGNCAQQLPITSQDWSSALSAALGLAGTAAATIATGGGSLPLAGTVASATVNALSLKPRMERGGSISGAAGAMAGQVPYLVRERPEQAVPGQQSHMIGYPAFITAKLDSLTGYTEVESVHLEGIPATAAELAELENILKEGVIL